MDFHSWKIAMRGFCVPALNVMVHVLNLCMDSFCF